MSHPYRVTIARRDSQGAQPIELDFASHEDISELIEKVRERGILPEDEIATFVLGLKMFSGVLLAHRNEELFADFTPHFGNLMKKLKGASAARN